jgi:hypothetical protein
VKGIKYQEVTDPQFARSAASSFAAVKGVAGDWFLHGVCPRCGKNMSFAVVRETYRGGDRRQEAEIVIFCTADGEYEGRPTNRIGCGAYWSLVIAEGG